jgi:protein tyrosine/serine phosphatase
VDFNGRLVRTAALATLVAVSPVISSAQPRQADAFSKATISKIRIGNFGRLNTTYYRGAQPTGRDYADLAALGVKMVIDLQRDGDRNEGRFVENAGMKFYRIPMTGRVAPTSEQQALFLKLVNDPANQPVFVHCAVGRHRTGVMTALYRLTHDGWTAGQAFREMKQYGFGLDFLHPEFKRFVYAYQPAAPAGSVVATRAAQ